jgi:hypothetical protein
MLSLVRKSGLLYLPSQYAATPTASKEPISAAHRLLRKSIEQTRTCAHGAHKLRRKRPCAKGIPGAIELFGQLPTTYALVAAQNRRILATSAHELFVAQLDGGFDARGKL